MPAVRPPPSSTPALRLVVDNAQPASPKPSEFDDVQLLAAMRNGDSTAARAVHERVRPAIDATLVRLFGTRDRDHEDLAQRTLVELVRSVDRFRGDCSLDTWVATLSAHVAFKEMRRRRRERVMFSDDALETVPHERVRGASGALTRDLARRVRAHLNHVDHDKAWTYLLHDACGYDLNEIAQITGVSVAAAQSRLVRGRRELRRRLEADPELEGALAAMEEDS